MPQAHTHWVPGRQIRGPVNACPRAGSDRSLFRLGISRPPRIWLHRQRPETPSDSIVNTLSERACGYNQAEDHSISKGSRVVPSRLVCGRLRETGKMAGKCRVRVGRVTGLEELEGRGVEWTHDIIPGRSEAAAALGAPAVRRGIGGLAGLLVLLLALPWIVEIPAMQRAAGQPGQPGDGPGGRAV